MIPVLRRGAIVLCGGKSSRMGHPKHMLPFGNEVALQRVVRILTEVTPQIVVVASPGQFLPTLPEHCQVIYDEVQFEGPLSGLAYGLQLLHASTDAVYLSGCDTPLLHAEFVNRVFEQLGDLEVVVPIEGQFFHPLAAVYRTSLYDKVRQFLESGERRPRKFIESCKTVRLPVSELRCADPELDSLLNMNSPEEYAILLDRANLSMIKEEEFRRQQ